MGRLLLSGAAAVLVTCLAVGTAHAGQPNFRPRGPFPTVQDCEAAKAAAAKRGEQQGAGACFAGNEYGPGLYYMVRNA